MTEYFSTDGRPLTRRELREQEHALAAAASQAAAAGGSSAAERWLAHANATSRPLSSPMPMVRPPTATGAMRALDPSGRLAPPQAPPAGPVASAPQFGGWAGAPPVAQPAQWSPPAEQWSPAAQAAPHPVSQQPVQPAWAPAEPAPQPPQWTPAPQPVLPSPAPVAQQPPWSPAGQSAQAPPAPAMQQHQSLWTQQPAEPTPWTPAPPVGPPPSLMDPPPLAPPQPPWAQPAPPAQPTPWNPEAAATPPRRSFRESAPIPMVSAEQYAAAPPLVGMPISGAVSPADIRAALGSTPQVTAASFGSVASAFDPAAFFPQAESSPSQLAAPTAMPAATPLPHAHAPLPPAHMMYPTFPDAAPQAPMQPAPQTYAPPAPPSGLMSPVAPISAGLASVAPADGFGFAPAPAAAVGAGFDVGVADVRAPISEGIPFPQIRAALAAPVPASASLFPSALGTADEAPAGSNFEAEEIMVGHARNNKRKAADEDLSAYRPSKYTWLHFIILVIVAFVLGMLVWRLIDDGVDFLPDRAEGSPAAEEIVTEMPEPLEVAL